MRPPCRSAPLIDLVKPGQDVEQGRLAATGRPENAGTRRDDDEIEVLQNRVGRAVAAREGAAGTRPG